MILFKIVYLKKIRDMENSLKKLKIVLISSFIHEIHLAKGKLENKGIRSFIVGENLNSTIGTAFVEGYKLQVDIADFENARTILSLGKT